MAVADIDGLALAYDDLGTSADVIVLVHGHPFNRTMWDPQREALANAGWRVIIPDLRGYGESGVTPGITTLHRFASDIAALLDALGVGSVVIAGLSMGGQIAMEFCRMFPERVRGLLLAATFPQEETPDGRLARYAMAERLSREGMAPYADDVLGKMLAPASIVRLPAVAAQMRKMMRHSNPVGAAAALRGRAERPSYVPTLAALSVPALVVVGREDAFTTLADAEHMHALLSRSELVLMEGIGHMPNLEASAAFNAATLRLLASVRHVAAAALATGSAADPLAPLL
ncbi:MAG: alpha/beta hydrolase [Gemmatimonadaceae bacterium]